MISPVNIYYMLAYVFDTLVEKDPRTLGSEKFENAADLCAAILAEAVKKQVRQGIRKGYVPETAALTSLRGKLDWPASIHSGGVFTHRLVCAYDEFLSDIPLNRILKTTLEWLRKAPISPDRKAALAALRPYFKEVRELDPHCIDWRIQYDRNTRSYQLLMYLCRLVLEGLLQKEADGSVRVRDYRGLRKLHQLYELFILAYYCRHFPETNPENPHIPWALDDSDGTMLPQMKTDVQLTYKKKILIIDAKYYGQNTQEFHGSKKLRSQNLYQIFCYVKNKAADVSRTGEEVSGLLLYALTDGGALAESYQMSGNRIAVRTLDLGAEFSQIREQLDSIAEDFLGCARPA